MNFAEEIDRFGFRDTHFDDGAGEKGPGPKTGGAECTGPETTKIEVVFEGLTDCGVEIEDAFCSRSVGKDQSVKASFHFP